jgi:threonyl-tRNA synthetase
MRLLQLHSDFVEYEPISKEISEAEETIQKVRKRLDEVVVVFVAVESQDDKTVAADAISEVRSFLKNVNCQKLLIYPYAHLSSDLARPTPALMILREFEAMARESIKEVYRAPFGWTKSLNIQTKGHPLAESAKTIIKKGPASEHAFGPLKPAQVRQSDADTLLPEPETSEFNNASSALRAEEKIQSYWYVIEPGDDNSTLIPIDKYMTNQNKKNQNLQKLINYEIQKRRTIDEQPPHVKSMKKLAIADYEPASDLGNLRFYPKGKLIKFLIERFVTNKVIKYGGIEVETPIMYDSHHPSMQSYFNRFPARQYNIISDSKNLFLRFAACFGQFLMAKDFQISYKSLPLRLYELTRYSFRKEKSGELVGLRRLRAFSMPDCHAFCKDINQAKQELVRRFELSLDVISGIGLSPSEDLEMAIRFTEDFYQENKELIGDLVSRYNKPVLVEMWKEKFFYFVLKWEFNFIDNLGKASALSTDQVDVENASRYYIDFVDEDGTKKYPIILHNSPSGAIERVIYALLEKAARVSRAGGKPSLPLWLTHTQVRIIPVGKQHLEYCLKLAEELNTNNIRADIDDRDESIAKKIRESESEWIHYTLVVGDKEIQTQKLVVRNRTKGIQSEMSLRELMSEISSNTEDKPHAPLNLPQNLSRRPLIMV